MKHFITLAFKNIFRQKKRSFTLGVNYAVVAFILTLLFAFSRGAAVNIKNSLVRSSAGHLTISGQFAKDGKIFNGLLGADRIMAAAAADGARRVFKRYSVQSMVYFNGLSKRLSFTGIDAASDLGFRDQAVFAAGGWEGYAADPNGVAVPAAVAEYFGLALDDEIVLSTRTRFGAFNTGILRVRGIYTTDNYFVRDSVLAHFDFLRALDLAEPDAATAVFVYFDTDRNLVPRRDTLADRLRTLGFDVAKPANDAEAISAVTAASTKYEADAEGRDRVMLKVATLDEVLGIVRTVLAAVDGVGAFLAAVMLFVIAVSIFINLRMSINERLREIGTMRALGVYASGVTGLFVAESAILALGFAAVGSAVAVLLSWLLRLGPSLPSGGNLGLFLDRGRLVLVPGLDSSLAVIAAIGLFAVVFSYFPARRGGAIPPVIALTKTF